MARKRYPISVRLHDLNRSSDPSLIGDGSRRSLSFMGAGSFSFLRGDSRVHPSRGITLDHQHFALYIQYRDFSSSSSSSSKPTSGKKKKPPQKEVEIVSQKRKKQSIKRGKQQQLVDLLSGARVIAKHKHRSLSFLKKAIALVEGSDVIPKSRPTGSNPTGQGVPLGGKGKPIGNDGDSQRKLEHMGDISSTSSRLAAWFNPQMDIRMVYALSLILGIISIILYVQTDVPMSEKSIGKLPEADKVLEAIEIRKTATSVVDTPKPIGETPMPVEETPKPVADTPMPVADTPKPVADTPKPVADTPMPVVDTPKPVADTPMPVVDDTAQKGINFDKWMKVTSVMLLLASLLIYLFGGNPGDGAGTMEDYPFDYPPPSPPPFPPRNNPIPPDRPSLPDIPSPPESLSPKTYRSIMVPGTSTTENPVASCSEEGYFTPDECDVPHGGVSNMIRFFESRNQSKGHQH